MIYSFNHLNILLKFVKYVGLIYHITKVYNVILPNIVFQYLILHTKIAIGIKLLFREKKATGAIQITDCASCFG